MGQLLKQEDNCDHIYPSVHHSHSSKPSSNWPSPPHLPPPILNFPDWSSIENKNTHAYPSAYAVSPNSSPEIYTPANSISNSDFWNYFDERSQKFGGTIISDELVWNRSWEETTTTVFDPRTAYDYMPLTLDRDSAVYMDEKEGKSIEEERDAYSFTTPQSSIINTPQPSTRKTNCGTTTTTTLSPPQSSHPHPPQPPIPPTITSPPPRRSSHLTRKPKPPSASSSSSKPHHLLRSTKTAHKIKYPPSSSSSSKPHPTTTTSKPLTSPQTTTTRASHNLVEKQYRTRLNSQFSTLLNVLPAEAGVREGEEKKVSKAEVLVLAKEYIRELEGERGQLERENRGLVEEVGRLRGVWDGIGGGDGGS